MHIYKPLTVVMAFQHYIDFHIFLFEKNVLIKYFNAIIQNLTYPPTSAYQALKSILS